MEDSFVVLIYLLIYAILLYSIYKLICFLIPIKSLKSISGKVINIRYEKNAGHNKFVYIVKYTNNKTAHSFIKETKPYDDPFLYKIGDDINVFYHKKHKVNYINSFRGFWVKLATRIFTIILVLFSLILYYFDLSDSDLNDAMFRNSLLSFLLTFCIGLLTLTLESFRKPFLLKKFGLHSEGTIISYEETKDIDNIKVFAPIIEFESDSGNKYNFKSTGFKYNKDNLGHKIRIIYNQNFPNFAEVDSTIILFIIPIISSIIFMFIFLTILYIVFYL